MILSLFLLSSLSLAQTSGGNIWWPVDGDMAEDLNTFVELYNGNIDRAPGFVKSLFGDQELNVHIAMDDGSQLFFGLQTEDAVIVSSNEGFEEPTMKVYTSESAINSIANAESPADELQAALDDGRIEFEGVTFGSKVKLFIMNIIMTIKGWFS